MGLSDMAAEGVQLIEQADSSTRFCAASGNAWDHSARPSPGIAHSGTQFAVRHGEHACRLVAGRRRMLHGYALRWSAPEIALYRRALGRAQGAAQRTSVG